MRRTAVRPLIATIALALAMPACLFFIPTRNPVSTYREFRHVLQSDGVNADLPDITIVLHSAGRDAVDVYSEDSEDRRIRIAEVAAEWLGEEFAFALPNDFQENVATADLERRLLRRSGARWTFTLDTSGLATTMKNLGHPSFNLIICQPQVETRYAASRQADYDATDVDCLGRGWEVTQEPLTVSLTLRPDVDEYLLFIAAALLGILLLGALAWFLGNRLREGPFRRRSPASVALGLIVGAIASVGMAMMIGVSASELGPSDNLALAKELGVGLYALSAGLPALLGVVPGLLFAVLLVKRRPWPEEPLPFESRKWPAPPPPPESAGSAPPPPLPGGVR